MCGLCSPHREFQLTSMQLLIVSRLILAPFWKGVLAVFLLLPNPYHCYLFFLPQYKYKRLYEKQKDKFTSVVDTPEHLRTTKVNKLISDVSAEIWKKWCQVTFFIIVILGEIGNESVVALWLKILKLNGKFKDKSMMGFFLVFGVFWGRYGLHIFKKLGVSWVLGFPSVLFPYFQLHGLRNSD